MGLAYYMRTNQVVLVGVLKDRRDLEILLRERWYRIPVRYAPSRAYSYLAFYQPAAFGRRGKCIRYYARVLERQTVRRDRLLPDELEHPRTREPYVRVRVGRIQTLRRPIRNIVPRRVTFGFTTLHRLRTARDLLQLYDVTPIEQMVADGLRGAGIEAIAQPVVSDGRRRCRLDFAVICRRGAIAIECDNAASHHSPTQRARDRNKDAFLRRLGWTVVRLSERDIVSDLSGCIDRIRVVMRELGGPLQNSSSRAEPIRLGSGQTPRSRETSIASLRDFSTRAARSKRRNRSFAEVPKGIMTMIPHESLTHGADGHLLTPEQRRIMWDGGTEAPFTGEYWDSHESGMYTCAACGADLFSSDAKFDSGTGWPSFTDPANREHVTLVEDTSHGIHRTEVRCARCSAHLGHVFDDGPKDRGGKRYCINSACLNLRR